jgi:hypothetical protein
MASYYLAIIADIKAKLESIQNIGKVHDYYRWNTDASRFLTLFAYTPSGADKQIRGWEFTRTSAPEHKEGAFFRHHRFKLEGYMTLKDDKASDKTFQQLVDNVCEKFRVAASAPTDTWYYLDGDNPNNSPVQVETIEVRTFGGALCHYAEVTLSVTERIVA